MRTAERATKRRAEGISPTDEKLGEHEQPRSRSGVRKLPLYPLKLFHTSKVAAEKFVISRWQKGLAFAISRWRTGALKNHELMAAVMADHVNVAYGNPMQHWAQDAMYVRRVQELVLNQVNYYFSTENLCKDEFLRVHMDGEGWVPIPLLASFARLRRLTTDLAILTEARATRLPVSSCTHTTPPSPPPCPAAGTVLLA